jgi:5'-AMP-activated protein kinase catalytic alpha subunit
MTPGSSPAKRNPPSEVPPPVVGNYEIAKTIGKGSFGKVKKATFIPTGDTVAVKIINRQMLTNSTGMDAKIAREIKILKLFSHQNICRLYDVITTPTDILVVMEHIRGKELYDVIVERGKLSESDARYIFQQIVCAIEYWHHYRVVHRDLKPENILLEPDLTVKVIDFGLANLMKDGVFLRTSCGSPNYAAPEVISGRLYVGPEIDVWSSGVILYALLCGCLPFDEETIPQLFKKIKAGEFRIPSHVSPEARDLIKRMLTVDPLERITIPQLRDHPWFAASLPRFLQFRPSLFDNAHTVDRGLIPLVASTVRVTPADVHHALDRREHPKMTKLQRTIVVAYNVLADAKRRNEIEEMKKLDKSETESTMTHGASATAAMRELNQGLMLTTSPAIAQMLDGGGAGRVREQYNNQSFMPASMQDVRAISQGSMRIAASPGTLHFAGNPMSYNERVGSLQQTLASVPKSQANAGGAAGLPGATNRTSQPASSNTSAMVGSMQHVGSVAKHGAVYDAEEATIAVENNVGWRVGIMSERPSASLMLVLYQVLRDVGMEWKSVTPFVLLVRRKGDPSAVLQVQPMRVADKHDQGFILDLQMVKGNSLGALEMAIALTDRLVLRLA